MAMHQSGSLGRLAWALLWFLLPLAALDQPGRVGGWRDRSVSDPEMVEAASFAVKAYNEASNSRYYYKWLRILDAESQVVAGIKYSVTLELVKTLCEKKDGLGLKDEDLQHCEVAPEPENQICTFQIWSQPWLKKTQLLHMSCKAATS